MLPDFLRDVGAAALAARLLVLVATVLQLGGCTREDRVRSPAATPGVEERARALSSALVRHDWGAVAASAAIDGEVRVEIRQVLTETDERDAVLLTGREAFLVWLARLEPDLDATRADARWPGGLRAVDSWHPLSSCVDARSRAVPRGTLALRRVCFADARSSPATLSYLVFAEAK